MRWVMWTCLGFVLAASGCATRGFQPPTRTWTSKETPAPRNGLYVESAELGFRVRIPGKVESLEPEGGFVHRYRVTGGQGVVAVLMRAQPILKEKPSPAAVRVMTGVAGAEKSRVLTERWHGTDVYVLAIEKEEQGRTVVAYNVFIPSAPKSMMIGIVGEPHTERMIVALMRSMLSTLDADCALKRCYQGPPRRAEALVGAVREEGHTWKVVDAWSQATATIPGPAEFHAEKRVHIVAGSDTVVQVSNELAARSSEGVPKVSFGAANLNRVEPVQTTWRGRSWTIYKMSVKDQPIVAWIAVLPIGVDSLGIAAAGPAASSDAHRAVLEAVMASAQGTCHLAECPPYQAAQEVRARLAALAPQLQACVAHDAALVEVVVSPKKGGSEVTVTRLEGDGGAAECVNEQLQGRAWPELRSPVRHRLTLLPPPR